MLSTYLSYNLIARDVGKAIGRVENQPVVARDTAYYLENITKVKTIEEFVDDDRLFKYAMKAHGLGEMDYAKAFMVKAMEEGISDPDSFANKLTDKRYFEFVKTFNFAARADRTTSYIPAQQGITDRYTLAAVQAGVPIDDPVLLQQNKDFTTNIAKVKSIDEFLANNALYVYAMKAHGLTSMIADREFMRDILESGVADPDSLANKQEDKRFAQFAASLDFARLGERATTYNSVGQGTVDRYNRQTLEENAGRENEGVRLALYFERKAGEIDNVFEILADRALSQVVRTALGIPQSLASANIDRQAAMIEDKLDLADFKDPEALGKFLQRFASMWEIENPSAPQAASVSILFAQPAEYGVSTDLLLSMQKLRF